MKNGNVSLERLGLLSWGLNRGFEDLAIHHTLLEYSAIQL